MMNFKGRIQRIAGIAGLTATVLMFSLGSAAARADGDMSCHPGMGMSEHGHGMGMGMSMWGGMGHGMHGMQPHNAAEHFLKMGPSLNLTDTQITQLTKLRDEYIEKNATAEEQLKVAYEDLGRALYADSVDMKAVNALFEKIGKMDSQLWHAYAQQLHDIKAMLTAEQKQTLHDMWHEGPHGMYGEMPRHHGDMSKRKGMGM
jgi:Spy/CpxP family protein refolding chaperone